MPEIISDDIGSFPLPEGTDKGEVRKELAADGRAFDGMIAGMMRLKKEAGIKVPNYPQVQDMITGFLKPMQDLHEEGEPYLVKKEYATIPEISACIDYAKEYFRQTREPLKMKVCITGPLEIYLKGVGGSIQEDLLMNIAESLSRFIENAGMDSSYLKTCAYSIDEPGLGLNPGLAVDADILCEAWEACAKKAGKTDVQAHLHSAAALDKMYNVTGINVLGIEYARDPKAFDLIDKSDIESYDKFLRIGIARTDIHSMVSEYNQGYGTDLWKTKEYSLPTRDMENPGNIGKRLAKAYDAFGERIRYAGPDCGLGGWPAQEPAYMLLKNTAEAVDEFNRKR